MSDATRRAKLMADYHRLDAQIKKFEEERKGLKSYQKVPQYAIDALKRQMQTIGRLIKEKDWVM